MQDEQSWIENQNSNDSMAKERYEYFNRPEPRDNMSEIYYEDDPYLGRVKCRDLRIGMVRNASDENKKVVKAYLEPFPHTRIDDAKPLQGWYQSAVNESKQSRPRPCFTEAILTSPYTGYCAVGCSFCYVNNGMRGYRGTGLIVVPMRYGEQVAKQLTKVRRAAAGYFSSFTDPFTPLEKYYHNTEQGARAFVEQGLPIFFLSRLRYPDWAVDLLTKNPHSYAQKSINTSDPEDWRHLSPGALPLQDHMRDITRLRKKGIYVSIQVNPVVPGITSNEQIVKLFKMLADAGANHVIVKFVEAGYSWAPAVVDRMKKIFGERGNLFESLFNQNIGGERTIDEEYRIHAHRLYSTYAKRYGLTYATCYEYKYERDEAGNILSKTGVSIGREFTTADQCHGHRVPVYARSSENELFRALDECPPSGCLYCASENEEAPGSPRCGDPLAGQATAIRYPDLKVPIGEGKKRLIELPLV